MEDWIARSEREAAAMLADERNVLGMGAAYNALLEVISAAYRKGALDGMTRATEILNEQAPSS